MPSIITLGSGSIRSYGHAHVTLRLDSTGTSIDPYWNNVTFLLTGDDLLDHSSLVKTMTNNGGVVVSTATKKFGTGSLTTGTGYLTSSLTSTNTIGLSNDFTVEFWFYPNGTQSAWVGFCGNYMDGGYGSLSSWAIGYDGAGTGISCSCAFASGSAVGTSTATVTTNTWHHLAYVRYGSVFTMYIDGVAMSSYTDARAIYDGGSTLEIGSYIRGGYKFNGFMDDFRITKGTARYTSNFTPPTAALPNGSDAATLFSMTSVTFSSPIVAGAYSSGANTARAEMFGPTQAQLQSYYNSNNSTLASLLSVGTYFTVPTNGYQRFVIPADGNYQFVVQGGGGGYSSYAGANGCKITATFSLLKTDVIWIAVGHHGADGHTTSSDWDSAGGGGATFVAKGTAVASSTCLVCAAGGQGARENRFGNGTPPNSSSANGSSGSGFNSFKSLSINGSYGGYAGYYSYGGFGGGNASDDSYGNAGGYDGINSGAPNSFVDASGTSVTRSDSGENRRPNAGYVTITKL